MADEDRVAAILVDWSDRRERGEAEEPEEVIRAHPDLTDALRRGFAALECMDLLFPSDMEFSAGVPETIGPYRVLEELGSGGMGTVYLAEDEGGARVALKVVHPHLLERRGFFKRFLREAEIGRRVVHENVVRTLDVDAVKSAPGVCHYLVMEHVQGRTLRQLLVGMGTVPEGLLREIARQAASGLAAIHAEGIIHRDLKPENLLITDDQRVRIMDLGVAKDVAQSMALTQDGGFAGSLFYAAPEQFRQQEVGPAADLYSLGVLLHELATGENPFRGAEAAGVLRAHLDLVPPRACEANPDVTRFFSEVLAWLLEKDPARRPRSAEELVLLFDEGERSAWWIQRARSVLADRPHLPRIPVRKDTALQGRRAELDLLHERWSQAIQGRGNTLLIEGEAGIGKTRVLDAFLEGLAGEEATILYGSYPPSGGLGGLSDAIRERFGAVGLEEALHPYLRRMPRVVPMLTAMVNREEAPEGSDTLPEEALHAALVTLMRGFAEERPLIWIVEDLHFASADSRGILLSLARAVEGCRILLLLTTRPGLPEDATAHLSRLPSFCRAQLARLSAREVVLLLQDAFRSRALAEKLGGKIALKSDGVPFFVFEMIRGLKEGQFITELPDGSYVESKIVEEIEVPPAVKDLVEARLRDLTREERAILDVGAAAGFAFDPDLVARVLQKARLGILQSLAEVERRSGVVVGQASSTRFDHHQIQEVLYQGLPPDLRTEYHGLLAGAIEARADGHPSPEETCQVVQHQLRGRDPGQVIPHVLRAARHLRASHRSQEGIDLLDRALRLHCLLGDELRARMLLVKKSLHDLRSETARGRAAIEEALTLACNVQDRLLEAQARNALAMAHVDEGRPREARALAQRAIAIYEELRDDVGVAAAVVNLGVVYEAEGRFTEALAHFERGQALARKADHERYEAVATANVGKVLTQLGRPAEAVESIEKGLALFRSAGDTLNVALATNNLGAALDSLGRAADARGHFEIGLALAREIGNRRLEAMALGNLGVLCDEAGGLEEAIQYAEQWLVLAREVGDPIGEMRAAGNLGGAWLQLGEPERARTMLEASLKISRDISARFGEGFALQRLSDLADLNGDMPLAIDFATQAVAVRREIGHRDGVVVSLLRLGAYRSRAGDADGARAVVEEALELARALGADREVAEALALLACLSDADAEEALAALREAGEDGNTPEVRYRLWRATSGREHLDEAKRLLDHLVEHAPEEYRESMLKNVRLHREIMEAWQEHGAEIEAEGDS